MKSCTHIDLLELISTLQGASDRLRSGLNGSNYLTSSEKDICLDIIRRLNVSIYQVKTLIKDSTSVEALIDKGICNCGGRIIETDQYQVCNKCGLFGLKKEVKCR